MLKKILLLSDTHGCIDEFILKYARDVDEIWHAGDIGDKSVVDELEKITVLRAVYGNIDNAILRQIYPQNQRFKCEDVDILITHIAGYPDKYVKEVRDIIKNNPPNVFICGHSHILKIVFDKKYNFLFLNPGAAGISGFHQKRTMLRFFINKDKIEKMEVIEYPKKSYNSKI